MPNNGAENVLASINWQSEECISPMNLERTEANMPFQSPSRSARVNEIAAFSAASKVYLEATVFACTENALHLEICSSRQIIVINLMGVDKLRIDNNKAKFAVGQKVHVDPVPNSYGFMVKEILETGVSLYRKQDFTPSEEKFTILGFTSVKPLDEKHDAGNAKSVVSPLIATPNFIEEEKGNFFEHVGFSINYSLHEFNKDILKAIFSRARLFDRNQKDIAVIFDICQADELDDKSKLKNILDFSIAVLIPKKSIWNCCPIFFGKAAIDKNVIDFFRAIAVLKYYPPTFATYNGFCSKISGIESDVRVCTPDAFIKMGLG